MINDIARLVCATLLVLYKVLINIAQLFISILEECLGLRMVVQLLNNRNDNKTNEVSDVP